MSATYECVLCEETFNTPEAAQEHVEDYHNIDDPEDFIEEVDAP